jgi:hypothetical protein
MTPKKKGKGKIKRPNYGKTETFADYQSAAAAFTDFNPQSDTVFVGASIDPSVAQRKANRASSISASKGASEVNYNDQKVYRTKNEAGQTVYVHLKKHDKKEYSNGGIMKAKKKMYNKGGKIDPTKKMKKADEAEIDRRYESTVGRNPRTGELNYPNSADMDKVDATAGSAGNDSKLRKAISDKYYAEKRKEMGIDKIKTYKKGGMLGKKKALDFNKDGKISKADFILMAKAKAKKK